MWDGRTRKYAILEKKIIFEKNMRNGTVSVEQALTPMVEKLHEDINTWKQKNGVYGKNDLWRPEVKILDEVTTRSKISEIVGKNGELISFGHLIFEIRFSVKLSQ